MFKALGDPTRLRIFTFLRGCCCPVALDEEGDVRPVTGPTVGEVCCSITGIDHVTSTLSHHLKELREAGLICMERRGKNILCAVRPEVTSELAAVLSREVSIEGRISLDKGKPTNVCD
jgi:ArsR family transcriptional regulator